MSASWLASWNLLCRLKHAQMHLHGHLIPHSSHTGYIKKGILFHLYLSLNSWRFSYISGMEVCFSGPYTVLKTLSIF